MILICSILHDCRLLPFFLEYYSKCGVTKFVFAVWVRQHPKLLESVAGYLKGFNAVLVCCNRIEFNGEFDSALHNHLRRRYVHPDQWYVICDLDEFHVIPGFTRFEKATAAAARDGCHAICGTLIDRITADGGIPKALLPSQSLGSQFPIGCYITAAILGGCAIKVQLAHASIPIEPGHHVCQCKPWNIWGEVHHFKWWGSVINEQRRRLESYRRQSLPYANESSNLITYFKEHSGRLCLRDQRMSCFRIINDPLDRPE